MTNYPTSGRLNIGDSRFPQNRLASITFDIKIKTLAAHGAELNPYWPLDDHG